MCMPTFFVTSQSEERTRREILDVTKELSRLQREHDEREETLRLRMRGLQENLREARIVGSITSLPLQVPTHQHAEIVLHVF